MTQRRTPPRIAPLQRFTAQPVTDPDLLAALDEKRARQQEADFLSSLGAPRLSEERAGGLDLFLAQYRRLPEADRPVFVAQLLAGLSENQCLELMGWAIAALPQDAFQQLKTQLEAHSSGSSDQTARSCG
jgi:hypothetical protein